MRPVASELVGRADAVLVMTTYVRAALAGLDPGLYPFLAGGVTVSGRYRPGVSPVRHVRIRRSGGTMINLVEDAARLDYQVRYDTGDAPGDEAARTALANLVSMLVYSGRNEIVAGGRIGQSVEFVGPGVFEDPDDPAREIILFTVETRLRVA